MHFLKIISTPISPTFQSVSNSQPPFISKVETAFLQKSMRTAKYPIEKIMSIETDSPFELGKLTALRFIEWVIQNPTGVIALPTGKTPEYFIKFLEHYKKNWNNPSVQTELQSLGIVSPEFPNTSNLKFVQLDEFFPINPKQENSFKYYIKKYYFPLLNLSEKNILTIDASQLNLWTIDQLEKLFPPNQKIDLTLLTRKAKNLLESNRKNVLLSVNKFCKQYEEKIRESGGIGFFLGGIGPDGHIAFNMQGTPFNSRTRLVQLNYPSAAAAASDLGGMQAARDKTAITIGLDTITAKKDATIIIMAAGETKADQVAYAIENPANIQSPASCLQNHPNSRFYITKGAASKLQARKLDDIQKAISSEKLPFDMIESIIIEIALKLNKTIDKITESDLTTSQKGLLILPKIHQDLSHILKNIQNNLIKKLENGINLPSGKKILHTSPHHDDIILSYLPAMQNFILKNLNYFVYLTSGFTSVSNGFIQSLLKKTNKDFILENTHSIFNTPNTDLLEGYKQAYFRNDEAEKIKFELFLFLQAITTIFNIKDAAQLIDWIELFSKNYLKKQYPGQKDSPKIQTLKGMIRESESNRKWQIMNVPPQNVHHLRLPFYTGDFFNPIPSIEKDAAQVLALLKTTQPDIVTVAFDPEGSGPDTHYKVLQTVAQALRMTPFTAEHQPSVIGYRNIWFRFNPSEATHFIPANQTHLLELKKMFLNCFSSQRKAEFPSPYFDGPFSSIAQSIQTEQLKTIKTLLGKSYFENHPDPRIKHAKGLVFLKEMNLKTFFNSAAELEKRTVQV